MSTHPYSVAVHKPRDRGGDLLCVKHSKSPAGALRSARALVKAWPGQEVRIHHDGAYWSLTAFAHRHARS